MYNKKYILSLYKTTKYTFYQYLKKSLTMIISKDITLPHLDLNKLINYLIYN